MVLVIMAGEISGITTRITGLRERTLISKTAGHRNSGACDGSIEPLRGGWILTELDLKE
jgi:hypothetical protein